MPGKGLLIGLVVAVLSLSATATAQRQPHAATPPAHAAQQPATHGADAHGHSAEGEHAKPALLEFDPGSAIWTIIVFVLLLVVLRLAAWKPILRVLQERESFIERSIADAKDDRAKAERLLADYRVQLDKARDEAAALLDKGRRDADAARQRLLDDARREAGEVAARARREIELAADAALKELYDRAAELSVDLARRIVSKELSAADHRRLIEESLAEMRKAGKTGMN